MKTKLFYILISIFLFLLLSCHYIHTALLGEPEDTYDPLSQALSDTQKWIIRGVFTLFFVSLMGFVSWMLNTCGESSKEEKEAIEKWNREHPLDLQSVQPQ